jgi:PII-like signaling protein
MKGRNHDAEPDGSVNMRFLEEATLLRIIIGEDDRHHKHPLYEAIVLKAREMHLSGATVFRGPLGFGHSRQLHTSKILRLSFDLPVVIEIVDKKESIEAFLREIEGMIGSGLVTLQKVRMLSIAQQSIAASAIDAWSGTSTTEDNDPMMDDQHRPL